MSDLPNTTKHRFRYHERWTQWVIEEWSKDEGCWIFAGYAPPQAVEVCAHWQQRFEDVEAERDELREALSLLAGKQARITFTLDKLIVETLNPEFKTIVNMSRGGCPALEPPQVVTPDAALVRAAEAFRRYGGVPE